MIKGRIVIIFIFLVLATFLLFVLFSAKPSEKPLEESKKETIPQTPVLPPPTHVTYIKEEDSEEKLKSKIVFCKEYSDLTSYCVYEDICIAGDEVQYLVDDPKLQNSMFENSGNINTFDHYEKIDGSGKVIEREVNTPLPFRSFLTGRYLPLKTKQSVTYHSGCHSLLSFDFQGHNIFHWAIKVSPLFIHRTDKYNTECKNFESVRLANRKNSEVSDWQKKFLEISSNVAPNNVHYMQDDPNRGNVQCFKRLLIPGSSIFIFTGPTEAIQFRKSVAKVFNLQFERKTVVIVKRKNREIRNQQEMEDFVKSKVGESNVNIIYFDGMNFEQQVKIMSTTSMLIAVHGAGLTNSIFLPSTSIVLEITSPHFHYPLYERVALQSGHIYFRFVTQRDSSIHNGSYSNVNGRKCFSDINCIVHWKDAPLKVDMAKFAVIFEQAMEVL